MSNRYMLPSTSAHSNLDVSLDNMRLAMESFDRATTRDEIRDACVYLVDAAEDLITDADSAQEEMLDDVDEKYSLTAK